MVFPPYRLFCFLLLKRAGISTLQVSFTCNQMAWHKKYSIYDSLRHKYTVFSTRICALNYFTSVKPIREATASTKNKAVQFSPIPLDVYFFQRRRHDCRRAFSLLESVHRFAPPASSLFGKLLHPRKAKRYSFHPYRLMFIFSQHRRHGCHMAFSLLEFVRRIAPPMRTHEK